MIIALTGTPGTGKTSVADQLKSEYRVIGLTEFVKERGLGEENGEFEVDVDAMVEALDEEIDENEDSLIEGHLAHHFPADFCVVLRCEPGELEERLSGREYSAEKVEENLESEALDIVLQEAVEKQQRVIEIDTTGREASEVAEEVNERIEEKDTGFGEVDWSDYF